MNFLPESVFGLRLDPGKTYSQTVEQSFSISMASINFLQSEKAAEEQRVSICLETEGTTFVLCNLCPGKVEQQPLSLTFLEDQEITFFIRGNESVSVDLVGNGLVFSGDLENDDDEEIDSDLEGMDFEELMGDDMESVDSELEDEVSAKIQELEEEEEEPPKLVAKRKNAADAKPLEAPTAKKVKTTADSNSKKEELKKKVAELKKKTEEKPVVAAAKAEVKSAPAKKEEPKKTDAPAKKEAPKKAETPAKKESPKKAEAPAKKEAPKKTEAAAKKEEPKKTEAPAKKAVEVEKKSTEPAVAKKGVSKTLPSGLVITDTIVGTGPKAKRGKKISVRYIGKLKNGKVFDSNTKGKPFQFKLGASEVIKGWDVGFEGMQVGGTRKLSIPANMAYGARGAPPAIPPNAQLEFEMKLLEVKGGR